MNPQTNIDQGQLVHRREKLYFIFAVMISALIYLLLAVTIVGLIYAAFFMVFSLFFHYLYMANIRSNGVRITPQQFPTVYEKVVEISNRMGLESIPDVFIVESGGVLNAFATRFFGRNMVILYSEIVELIETGGDEELSYVIAHELAHLKRRHIGKQLLIFPVMFIPFVGEAYSRACEYTCDRFAAYYTGNTEAAKNGLTILAVGKILYKRVNRTIYLEESAKEKGFFIWLSELVSTHPPLPKRIREIQVFLEGDQPLKPNRGKAFLWTSIAIVGSVLLYLGFGYVLDKVIENAPVPVPTMFETEESSPLMSALYDGDTEQVKTLLTEEGHDPSALDPGYNSTPLLTAVNLGDLEAVELLLEAGADPNISDADGFTPLMGAATYNHVEMISLLKEAGADVNVKEKTMGWTALMYAASNGHEETTKLLLELGADKTITDLDNKTALQLVNTGKYVRLGEMLK